MQRILKKILRLMFIVIIIVVLLDFIPIKFAVKNYEKYRKNIKDKELSILVAKEDLKIDPYYLPNITWIANKENNPYNEDDIYFNLCNKQPYNLLSNEEFDSNRFSEQNNFIFVGNMKNIQYKEKTKLIVADFYADKWKIMYPIKRHTIRKYYAPKSYLTVYDFDISSIVAYLFEKFK